MRFVRLQQVMETSITVKSNYQRIMVFVFVSLGITFVANRVLQ